MHAALATGAEAVITVALTVMQHWMTGKYLGLVSTYSGEIACSGPGPTGAVSVLWSGGPWLENVSRNKS